MSPITSALLARCAVRGEDETTTQVCFVLGQAVDAGLISLPALLDLVRSCATADELGDALTMVAATVDDPLPVGYPPGRPGWTFVVIGEREGAEL